MREEILHIAMGKLEKVRSLANDELKKIISDEKKQPITYNHYYTDNIQNARKDSLKGLILKAVREAVKEDCNGQLLIRNTQDDSEKLLASLQERVVVNMDSQACAEALGGLNAYYKVRKLCLNQVNKDMAYQRLGCNENVC